MKKLLTLLTIAISSVALINCSKDNNEDNSDNNKNNITNTTGKGKSKNNNSEQEWVCGEYRGKTLYTGPRGGCYYKQSDGEKTYVDRKYCKCLK